MGGSHEVLFYNLPYSDARPRPGQRQPGSFRRDPAGQIHGDAGDNPNLELTLAFCHPFEQEGMVMAKPKAFRVQSGKDKDRSSQESPGNQGVWITKPGRRLSP